MDHQQTREFICAEVKKQVTPLIEELAEVKRQNASQSSALTLQGKDISGLKTWNLQFWSNGSGGPKGFIERRIEQEDERYEKLLEGLNDFKAEKFRQEGRTRLLLDQEVVVDKRLGRLKTYAGIAAVFGGSWIISLVRPILHAVALYVAAQIK